MTRKYNFDLGIKVGNTLLPDPASWNYTIGDLDTSGSRDATGLLHRAYVATKINYEFEWKAIEWEMLQLIVTAVQTPKFTLKAPDPRTFSSFYTGNYYVGDRTGNCKYFLDERQEVATFDLKMKFIEY